MLRMQESGTQEHCITHPQAEGQGLMTTMKPCPKCHSTEHLHIGINEDYLNRTLSAIVICKECNIYAQRDHVLTGPLARLRLRYNQGRAPGGLGDGRAHARVRGLAGRGRMEAATRSGRPGESFERVSDSGGTASTSCSNRIKRRATWNTSAPSDIIRTQATLRK